MISVESAISEVTDFSKAISSSRLYLHIHPCCTGRTVTVTVMDVLLTLFDDCAGNLEGQNMCHEL